MSSRFTALTLLTLALAPGAACGPPADEDIYENPFGPVSWQPGTWSVVWQDEFEGPVGAPPDPTRWTHAIGGEGWGNKELQHYTDRTDNASLDGAGNLVITARAETFEDNAYTSARLSTKGRFARAYGRFEARMRLAEGRGLWPAFWLLGDDFEQVGWPMSGEIDVVEQRGSTPSSMSSALHGPRLVGRMNVPVTRGQSLPGNLAQDFHVYAVEWDPASIVFLVDDVPFFQITPARRPNYARWVWDHPFYIIVNLAVGGLFPGNPDATTVFPASIAIDYVRVSERSAGGSDAAADAASDASDTLDAGAPD